MIAWLQPAALIGLLAVTGPMIVHLLRRRRARRVVVPSVRFVRRSKESAMRILAPADPWLLLMRIAIVACAALAAAHPLLLTDARTSGWSGRVARAVVVDTSASAAATAPTRIATESHDADPVIAIHTPDVGDGLQRALAWLEKSPPARREMVVVSDFQRGALTAADLSDLPADVGLRFVRVPSASVARRPSISLLDGDRRLETVLSTDEGKTAVTYAETPGSLDGLVIQAPAAAAERVASLLRVVQSAGALAPSAEQPIVVRFAGAGPATTERAVAAGWTLAAAERLLRSPEVAGVDVRVSPAGRALLVDVDADPGSLAAALAVKGALDARYELAWLAEHEPRSIADATLAAWARPAGPADAAAWRQTDESDGRWLWALALVLLGIEAIVRRTRDVAAGQEARRAA